MKASITLLTVMLITAVLAAPSSSDSFTIPADLMDAGGGRSASTAYTNDDSLGDVIDLPTSGSSQATLKSGFAGQLYEVTGLQLTAAATTVNEAGARQVFAQQVLDDASLLAVPSGVTWSVVSGPLLGINTNGLVTADKVLQNTPATVQGSYLGDTAQLHLTVQDVAADVVAFSHARYDVYEEAGTVNLTLLRTGSTAGAITVSLSTLSAGSTATAGADYTSITNQTVTFADGEASVSVPVTILPGNAPNEPNEFFLVQLSNPGPGVTLGSTVSAKVWIADPGDTTKPSVTIGSPAPNAGINEGATATVSGTAADNRGIKQVMVSLNTAAFADAVITLNSAGTSATYTAALSPLKPGPNIVAVKSIDTRGNESAVVTRTFYFVVKRPLVVNRVGTGTLTSPFPGTDATKQVGFPYTIKATPGTGQVFDGWTVSDATGTGITAAMQELPSLTFTHQEGLVLTANFIANPFTAAIIGTFQGLVWPSNAVPGSGTKASNETVGFFSATVTGTGSFTGTLKVDGLSLPVTGLFDNTGVARFGTARATMVTLARANKPGLDVALSLDMSGTSHKLTGTVSQRGRSGVIAQSDIDCNRAYYSATNKVPVALAGTTGRTWTVLLRHESSWPGLTSADYPQGDGYASGSVKVDGTVSFAGKLADHTPFTTSALLSEANAATLFVSLYGGKGSFVTQVILTPSTSTDGELAGSSTLWLRPYQNVQWYPWGWEEGIGVDVIGASYQVPAQVLWSGLNAMNPVYGNVAVTFKDGLLSTSVNKTANFFAATAAKVPTTDATWSFTLIPSTGVMSGTFPHSNGTKPTWQGVLIQRGANMGGYGYFMTTVPKVIDGTGESGRVEMSAK